jgi:precorrin-2 dehydrogenase / sirohydrochlorin ferrochelatase
MIPLHLDPAKARIALIGRAELAVRRLAWLRAGRADPAVFSDAPSEALRADAGPGLIERLPNTDDLAMHDIVWIADLPPDLAGPLYAQARAVKTIANVEDVLDQCDFHTPAVVRRGALLVSIGTGGASPAAAGAVRAAIEAAVPERWAELLDDIAAARAALKASGAGPAALKSDAQARISAAGL